MRAEWEESKVEVRVVPELTDHMRQGHRGYVWGWCGSGEHCGAQFGHSEFEVPAASPGEAVRDNLIW